jgi:photosystem II stability/assembly factor-like uncharacterized protein
VLKRTSLLAAALVVAGLTIASAGSAAPTFSWHLTPTGTTAHLRGVSAVSASVAWSSGYTATDGVVLRTTDQGATWQDVSPPDSAGLQYRDIEAFDADHAVVLAAGSGTDGRIYVTADGGQTWTLGFENQDPDPTVFYDCMTFFNRNRGLALSDPVGGKFRIIATDDGGSSWHLVSNAGMPPALPGEFAFAASGECLVSFGSRFAWFGSGGGAQARVFRSTDGGQTWTVSSTPMNSGPTAGIFALAFNDPVHGIAVGGDFVAPSNSPDAAAWTDDGGAGWQLADEAPSEYRSGATWVVGRIAVDVGPTGSDFTADRGRTWHTFDTTSFDTVDCAHVGACWASGAGGNAGYLVGHP